MASRAEGSWWPLVSSRQYRERERLQCVADEDGGRLVVGAVARGPPAAEVSSSIAGRSSWTRL